jgi:hypothetical protein
MLAVLGGYPVAQIGHTKRRTLPPRFARFRYEPLLQFAWCVLGWRGFAQHPDFQPVGRKFDFCTANTLLQ